MFIVGFDEEWISKYSITPFLRINFYQNKYYKTMKNSRIYFLFMLFAFSSFLLQGQNNPKGVIFIMTDDMGMAILMLYIQAH